MLTGYCATAQSAWKHGRLQVTPDKTGLMYADGTQFFWVGDTGWELLNRLTTKEVISYLDKRVEQGFNVLRISGLSPESFKRANRYGQRPLRNNDPCNPNEQYYARLDTIVRAMAAGLISTTDNNRLIIYHPPGYQSSSNWFQDDTWLDFNMIQSSHGERDAPNWDFVAADLKRTPKKPTLDAEPNYEDHPINPWPKWNPDSSYFRDYDVNSPMQKSSNMVFTPPSEGVGNDWVLFIEDATSNFPKFVSYKK